jgi:hypothetical protein
MAQRPRRQHTAAKVYLRGFADAASHVCTHARDGTVEQRNIRSVSVEPNFYTYVDDTGRPADAIEHWFDEAIENAVADVLRSLQEGNAVVPQWRRVLSMFVVTSLLRTATVRSFMGQIDQHTRPLLTLHAGAHNAGIDMVALTDAGRRDFLDAARDALAAVAGDPDEDKKSQLRTMLRSIDEWTNTIQDWNWEVSHAAHPTLITSDAPVAVLGAAPRQGWPGVLPKDSTVAVPISPTALLIASPLPLMGNGAVTDELATQVNTELVRNCFKAVFHHPDLQWPADLYVPPERPRLPEPTISFRPSPPGSAPTFPATYPDIKDAKIRALLDVLGATDTVD